MATTRLFARYTGGGTPSGTLRYGDMLIGVSESNPYNQNYSGVKWWSGADEDQGYIIAQVVSTEDQPSPDGNIGSVGFFTTGTFNNSDFVELTEIVTGYSAATPTDAKNWLLANGYWTSWSDLGDLIMFISGTSISGVTMNDLSTFGNDSSLSGNFTHSYYNDNQVLSLDGTNGFIQSPGFGASLDNKFTFETWVLSGTTSNGTIISEWGGPAFNPWCDAQSAFVNGNINIGVYFGGSIAGPTFSPNTWYNIVSVYDGTTLELYVDGVLSGSQSITKANPGNTHLTLGRYDESGTYIGGATGYLKGLVGQWKIYDYDLTSTSILNNYLSTKLLYDNSLVLNVDASKTQSYPGTGTTWYDLSLKNNNGTITNAVYSSTVGGTLNFDGTGDYVLIGQPIPSSSNYSISAWVYANDVSSSHNIVSSSDSPFWVASGTLYAGVGGNYFAVSSASFPTGIWKFVSMTFNDSTNTMKLYINGSLVNTNTNVTQTYTAQNTYIGSHYFGTPVSFWNGYIAQVNIYKSEQTSGQILDTYNKTKSRFGL